MEIGKTLYAPSRKEWHDWLVKNHAKEKEIWLVYYRKASGKPRIDYNDVVDEALCFGWIDSIVKGIDDEKFAQRISPRKKTSVLSQLNEERIRKLISEKRMTDVGLAAVAHVFDPISDAGRFKFPADILKAIRKNKKAWENFEKLPEHYKRIRVAYIARQREHNKDAFERSLATFIKKTEENKRFGFVRD